MDVTSIQKVNFPKYECRKIKDAPVTSPENLKSVMTLSVIKLHRYT